MRQNWEPLFRDHAAQKSLRSSIDLVRSVGGFRQLTTAEKAAPAQ